MSRFSPADLLLLLVVLVWGADFSVLKWALAAMHPHVANALRFVVSAGVLGVVYGGRCRQKGTSFLAPIRAGGWSVVFLGLLGEPITVLQVAGGGLIIGGLVLVRQSR